MLELAFFDQANLVVTKVGARVSNSKQGQSLFVCDWMSKVSLSSSILASSPLSHIKVHTLAQYMLVYFQNFNLLGCIIADVRVHFCLVSVWHSFCQSTPYLGSRLQHFLWGVLRYSNFFYRFSFYEKDWKSLKKMQPSVSWSWLRLLFLFLLFCPLFFCCCCWCGCPSSTSALVPWFIPEECYSVTMSWLLDIEYPVKVI